MLSGWWARLPGPRQPGSPAQHTLVGVLSAEFPAHAVVDLPDARRPAGWQVAVRADVDGTRVHSVEVALPEAPLLWYVELPEPGEGATTLVAFSDARHAEGTLLSGEQARAAGVAGRHQVAALRWWTGTGLVHQVYVAPQHRRRGVAGKLVQAAYGIQAARGLPGLHGDGRRTDDGERWRAGLPDFLAWRLAPRSERLPSMTPGE
ncbi:GNAT family N-acetyltransferase [Geodermatophilus sp. SYSU D00965]